MPGSPESRLPLSAILEDVAAGSHPEVSVAELTERFGGRALGALIMVFAIICMLPLPPGATTVFGLPLVLLAPQLAAGARAPWLPAKLRNRAMATRDFSAGLARVMPWLKRLEALSRPRLSFMFGGLGQRLIGVVCTLLALVLILPIPLGNLLPATAVAILALSLVQRDGLLAMAGYAVAVASAGVLVIAFGIVASFVRHVLSGGGLP